MLKLALLAGKLSLRKSKCSNLEEIRILIRESSSAEGIAHQGGICMALGRSHHNFLKEQSKIESKNDEHECASQL